VPDGWSARRDDGADRYCNGAASHDRRAYDWPARRHSGRRYPQTGPSATPLDPTQAQAATALITPLGQQHAPAGAKAVGSAIAGNFQQGQSLESQIQINPGKCYTIVGVGLPQVANLDISLSLISLIPGIPGASLAADNTVGSTAIVGDKPNCFKSMSPISTPVKLTMTVSQGSGVAAAQVFEK
jgi:hypothetical protein